MNITDQDELTPDEFDKKRRKERKAYLDKQSMFSKKQLLDFGAFCVLVNTGDNTVDINSLFEDWQN